MDPDEDVGSNVGPTPPQLPLAEFRRAYADIHTQLGIDMPDALT